MGVGRIRSRSLAIIGGAMAALLLTPAAGALTLAPTPTVAPPVAGTASAAATPAAPGTLTGQVVRAAHAAGITLRPVAPSTATEPVAAVVDAARAANALRLQALERMSPADWIAAAQGAAKAVGMLDVEPGAGPPSVAVDRARRDQALAGLAAMDVEPELLWQATATMAAGVDRAVALLDAGATASDATHDTPLGSIVIDDGSDPDACDDTYTEPAFLVIDQCGDDTYAAPAGGADGLSATPIAIVIDTVGNDTALPQYDGAHVPALGAATNGGIAIAVDTAGHDVRSPGSFGDFGSYGGLISGAGRLAGYGILSDRAGDDDYRVLGFTEPSKNGAGFFNGVGLLIDEAGDDIYGGDTFQQGSGWFGASFGLLADLAGNDRYHDISTYSQGSGGVGGVGVLLDAAGTDEYEASSIIEQGAGDCGGVGALFDLAGGDTYTEPAGMSQGFGGSLICTDEFGQGAADFVLDLLPGSLGDLVPWEVRDLLNRGGGSGAGLLFDAQGDDRYQGSYLTQGVHYGAGVGALVDAGGADAYTAYGCAQGYGSALPSDPCTGAAFGLVPLAGAGVLADASGNDFYDQGVVDGGGVQPRGQSGLAIDLVGDGSNDPRTYSDGYNEGWSSCGSTYEIGYDDGYNDGFVGNPHGNPDPGSGYDDTGSGSYDDGYAEGCADADQWWYAQGYNDGYFDGASQYESGYNNGWTDCYWTAWNQGYSDGWNDGQANNPNANPDPGPGYDPSGSGTYDDGYAEGCADATPWGYAEGYGLGYVDGGGTG